MTVSWYQLLGSLPHLAGFARLKTLPIGPLRYEERLRLLDPVASRQIAWLRARLWPERSSFVPGPELDEVPPAIARLAERAAHIAAEFARRTDEPDQVALERERLAALWQAADRLTSPNSLGFEAVVLNVVRWDIANAWLAGDAEGAAARIDALADDLAGPWVMHV